MTVNIQRPIKFINDCDCIVDYDLLEKAILWWQDSPTRSIKHIYLMHNYPTITIKKQKIFVHKIIYSFVSKIKISRPYIVHHIDNNRLNNKIENLKMLTDAEHQSLHAKGRPLTQSQRDAISKSNKNRKIIRRDSKGRIMKKVYEGVIDNE